MSPAASARVRELVRHRALWLVLLLAIAFGYYGSYYRHGIGFRDEGQTVALGAQRLLAGEVPLKDVVLNYNLLWFYPVVALFKVFGVDYVLLRAWCFALSTLTAVLGFLLVEKASRRPWFAWIIGVLLVLLPGSTFKNYIPLLAVANTLCLLHFVLGMHEPRGGWRRVFIGGVVLGLTFLIRIDIGYLVAAIWIGVLLLQLVSQRTSFGSRVGVAFAWLALLASTVVVLHVPFYIDAQRRGFDQLLLREYHEKWNMLAHPVAKLVSRKPPAQPAISTPVATSSTSATLKPPAVTAKSADKQALTRAGLKDLEKSGQNRGADFLFLMYAPVVSIGAFIGAAGWLLVSGWRAGKQEEVRRGLSLLVLVGGALTTFPQFFFFRPDMPHLSEFMPGFFVSAGAAIALLWARTPRRRSPLLVLSAFLLIHTAIYVWLALPDRWLGTIAMRSKRTKFFGAENGVNVFVTSRELAGLTAIQRIVRDHAGPDDYVVCYPYSPGINLLANRRTYEKNVYVDNATRSSNWDAEAIARIERFKPAVIVLSDWDINGTDSSRFSVWAVKAKTYIQTNYVNQGTYLEFEVFTRP